MTATKDYSQNGEQEAVLAAFEGFASNKRFLDIGAWNAFELSNTRALFELGWSGLLIEPSPAPMLELIKVYGNEPRVTLLQALVYTDSRFMRMHASADALSTAHDKNYEKWKREGGFVGHVTVPAVTLEEISVAFGHFDFWSIDAEGFSADLLLAALRMGIRPRCFCVEHDDRVIEVQQAATKVGYKVTMANQENLVMVY